MSNQKSENVKAIIGSNLKNFIQSTGRSVAWASKRTGIPTSTFYKLYRGEGDLDKHLEKITEVFGISDPFYFHDLDFKVPKTIVERQTVSNITQLAAANYVAVKGEEIAFKNTLEMLDDFIYMIDTLKSYERNLSHHNHSL